MSQVLIMIFQTFSADPIYFEFSGLIRPSGCVCISGFSFHHSFLIVITRIRGLSFHYQPSKRFRTVPDTRNDSAPWKMPASSAKSFFSGTLPNIVIPESPYSLRKAFTITRIPRLFRLAQKHSEYFVACIPERFVKDVPTAEDVPREVWINKPLSKKTGNHESELSHSKKVSHFY